MASQLIFGRQGKIDVLRMIDDDDNDARIWDRIITYVLLSGYSPFRSEDPADLIEETAQAKINFHARYWNNVSAAAKDFILMLLNPDPSQRPTAAEALKHPVSKHPGCPCHCHTAY